MEHVGVEKVSLTGGDVLWYLDDRLHRIGLPAHIERDGTEHWYVYGRRHRIDGPAIIYPDGRTSWYVDGGYRITDRKTFQLKSGVSDETLLALILKYGDME